MELEDSAEVLNEKDCFQIKKLTVLGYPYDKNKNDADLKFSKYDLYEDEEIKFDVMNGLLHYPCDTTFGMSGGPVICDVVDVTHSSNLTHLIGVHIKVCMSSMKRTL